MSAEQKPYVILGCGYTGTRLAQTLLAEGVPVRACARRLDRLEPLRALHADLHPLDAARPRQFGPALHGLSGAVVVYSIPGVPGLPAGEAVRRAADAALSAGARSFIYLSTTGVYGRSALPDNDEWVNEDSSVDMNDPDMLPRLSDEAAVSSAGRAGLRATVLRLSAIYGPPLWPENNLQPGRGVRQRLRQGQYKLWDGGRYYFSRIHVDDLVTTIRAAAECAPAGSVYVVGDDHPCPQGEYGRWLAAHLGLPEPPVADTLNHAGPRPIIRGRRICNRLIKEQLGITLRYPTYREGEMQIDAAEAVPGPPPLPAPPLASAAPPLAPTAPPPATAAPARPDWPFWLPLTGDVGAVLGLGATGVEPVELLAGTEVAADRIYLVVSGHPVAEMDGSQVTLAPLALVPPGARLRHPGAAAVVRLLSIPISAAAKI